MEYNKWAFHDIEPVYLQLIHKIKYAILSKRLSAGESATIRSRNGKSFTH